MNVRMAAATRTISVVMGADCLIGSTGPIFIRAAAIQCSIAAPMPLPDIRLSRHASLAGRTMSIQPLPKGSDIISSGLATKHHCAPSQSRRKPRAAAPTHLPPSTMANQRSFSKA